MRRDPPTVVTHPWHNLTTPSFREADDTVLRILESESPFLESRLALIVHVLNVFGSKGVQTLSKQYPWLPAYLGAGSEGLKSRVIDHLPECASCTSPKLPGSGPVFLSLIFEKWPRCKQTSVRPIRKVQNLEIRGGSHRGTRWPQDRGALEFLDPGILAMETHTGDPFTRALAWKDSSRNSSPAPDLVFFKLMFPRVFFSGVFCSQTLVPRGGGRPGEVRISTSELGRFPDVSARLCTVHTARL